ncbi:25337_t:CDS:2, partial [Racocetra persica]
MAGNFVKSEDNVFEEIEVDEEENEEVQAISVADKAPTAHKRIKVYTSQSTTPDQRRVLLFNVGEPFEVSMNKFNSEWWPLVTNVWTRFSYKNHTN